MVVVSGQAHAMKVCGAACSGNKVVIRPSLAGAREDARAPIACWLRM